MVDRKWVFPVAVSAALVFYGVWSSILVSNVARAAHAQERTAAAEERKARAEEGLTAAHQIVASGMLHASWPSAPIQFTTDTPKDLSMSPKAQGERFKHEIAAYLEVFPYRKD